jgi:hypothetical protein
MTRAIVDADGKPAEKSPNRLRKSIRLSPK